MNRSSIIVGWIFLTIIAIGVSNAAVGSVGDRVAPQPASVLQAAEGVAAFASSDEPEASEVTGSPTTSIIDPDVAATAVPSTTSTTSTSLRPTISTSSPSPTTTRGPVDTTTTTLVDVTTTTTTEVVDATTTTTSPPTTTTTAPPTTTSTTTTTAPPEVKRRTIESVGGWIRVEWTRTELTLLRRGGNPGFNNGRVLVDEPDQLVVLFTSTSKDRFSRIEVRLVEDFRIRVVVKEEPPDG